MIGFLIGIIRRTGDYVKVGWVKKRDASVRNEKRMQVYLNIYIYIYIYIYIDMGG